MNAINRLVMFGWIAVIATAAACGTNPECEADDDCSAAVDTAEWPGSPDGGISRDGKADHVDGGTTSTGADAGTEDGGDSNPDILLPETACAAGLHDGGRGACVADGECAPEFVLRPDGRCEGWVAAGALRVFNPTAETVLTTPGGEIFVAGLQFNASGTSVYAPQVWDPTLGVWSETATVESSPEGTRRICPMADGRFLTLRFGGYISSAPADSELIFDPVDGSWRPALNGAGISWDRPTCLLLQDGRTLVFESFHALVFEPSTETWSSAGDGPVGAHDFVATEPVPGVVFGAAKSSFAEPSRGLWKWTAADNSWTRTADWMLADELDRSVHTLSAAGDVILVRTEGDVVRYDPVADEFEQLGSIGGEVLGAAIDGSSVFVIYKAPELSAGLFDLETRQWRQLPAPPSAGRAVVLGSDYFIIAREPVRLHIAP